MELLGFWQLHQPPDWWHRVGGFNLVMALVLGLLLGISFRSFALVLVERERGWRVSALRELMGVVFLALGCLYALFAWPMLIWDRPARALASGAAVLVPLAAALRRRKNPGGPYPSPVPFFGFLFVGLILVVAVNTLLRAGFITLDMDRVPLLVDVTEETRPELAPGTEALGRTRPGGVTAHRVILWLPDGSPAADVWVYGDRVAFEGRALVVSKTFNALGVPNLYEFLSVHNGAKAFQGGASAPYFSRPFPHQGALAVHPWWLPVQRHLLNAWARLGKHSAVLGIRFVRNRSPDYPLTDAEGRPLKREYLLDLTLEGVPTSRGSSPLDRGGPQARLRVPASWPDSCCAGRAFWLEFGQRGSSSRAGSGSAQGRTQRQIL